MKYAYVYALFLVFVFHTSCGQKQPNVPQDNISKKYNGYSESQHKEMASYNVPMSMVRSVNQDRNGNILIAASWGGVFRYAGKSFTNLTINTIGWHRFWDVLEDRGGNLWFASMDSGVYSYNGETFQHFTTREGLVNNGAVKIYEDRAGNIWFSTGGGVSRYDGRSFRNFTTKDGLHDNDVRAIMEDKSGKLWIATGHGPCFYDGKTFTVLKNKDGKAFKNVWSIIEDKKGNIWFGDADGLWRYDGRTSTNISQRGAYGIIEDKKGNIWTSGPVNLNVWALSRYDAKSLYNEMPTVTEIKSGGRMDFLGILEANDGSIWFGSGGGVHRYDGKTITDFKSKN
jgi:ligand-binding sensor domain-containing protein